MSAGWDEASLETQKAEVFRTSVVEVMKNRSGVLSAAIDGLRKTFAKHCRVSKDQSVGTVALRGRLGFDDACAGSCRKHPRHRQSCSCEQRFKLPGGSLRTSG